MTLQERLNEAVDSIQPKLSAVPRVALVLGSGLGDLASQIDVSYFAPFDIIPHFKNTGASGHVGQLIFGELAGVPIACMRGRLHGYEGNTPSEVVFPLRVMHALGATTLVVTNAAGGINPAFNRGDIMLINDHINFTGAHPLTADEEHGGSAMFCDMSYAYTPALREQTLRVAAAQTIDLQQGVYLGIRGPSFETPAEIRAFRIWGADAVGMSTVFEVITAASLGMEVLGLSLITNMAAGLQDQPITGDEVVETAYASAQKLSDLLIAILESARL